LDFFSKLKADAMYNGTISKEKLLQFIISIFKIEFQIPLISAFSFINSVTIPTFQIEQLLVTNEPSKLFFLLVLTYEILLFKPIKQIFEYIQISVQF
jgi:hypothetical protein